jgi:hypothetical protein
MALKSEIKDYWTQERLTDELYLCLMKLESYRRQAYNLLYRIPIHEPTPIFKIKISDINEQIQKELTDRWNYKQEIDYILKEAVGRLFSNLNERYFLLSVKRLLQVELV